MTDPRILYISGPMTGKRDFNRQAFEDAAEDLTARGWGVINPHDLDHNQGVDNTSPDGFGVDDDQYEQFMERDLAALKEVDGIVFIDGWTSSGGSGREGHRAIELGKTLYLYRAGHAPIRMPEWLFLEYATTERRRPGDREKARA
jgi:hypothetical protein